MSGASAWKHVTSSRVREIREDVVFEGKKIHFQDSLSLGWRVTRVGVRDRDGSRGVGRGEDEDRAKRGRQFLLSFETEELHEIFLNYAKFSHKTVLALFNRYDYLS